MTGQYGDSEIRERLAEAIDRLPRERFAQLPTPLERLPHLGEAWGVPDLWIKRDDLTGLAFGGNKSRKLEFLIAQALQRGARTLVTGGRTQSNHTRDTAMVGKRYGMETEVLLAGKRPEPSTANVKLTELMGVPITWARSDNEALMAGARVLARLKIRGRRPYLIPAGGSNALGVVGYINAVRELVAQCEAMDERLPDTIVVAGGTGGTAAGLIAGCTILDLPIEVIAVCVIEPPYARAPVIAKLANKSAKLLRFKQVSLLPEHIRCEDGYVGEGYSIATPRGDAAIATLAQYEGIMLDPTYTGKTLGALHGMIEDGSLDPAKRILFWHTGGAIALFR